MNGLMEDDKKPFDAETQEDDHSQPDPDESLMLDRGSGRVWLVKIPRTLLKCCIRVYHDSLDLATNNPRIDSSDPGPGSDRPAFRTTTTTSFPTSSDEPDCYELDMVNALVSMSAAAATVNTRARTTILTGRIKHECSLRPAFSKTYRKQMRERHRKYNTPKRQIRMIDDAGVPGGRGGVNRLSSGVGVGAGNAFGSLIKTKPAFAKGTFERMARMPRSQLLDHMFALFQDPPRWGTKALREKTQQPEVYLKEVLSEVAFLHRSGEYTQGYFQTAGGYASWGENVPAGPSGLASSMSNMKMEGADEDEEDEDEDMEEVL
ncbi:transcription initiation factor IIF, beta subunit-domain-containing protein [Lyophyllum atratum]|nr:transcription initiation factor IIF, beta subunit-domain-containing protein [Lyophyllum atratum]